MAPMALPGYATACTYSIVSQLVAGGGYLNLHLSANCSAIPGHYMIFHEVKMSRMSCLLSMYSTIP